MLISRREVSSPCGALCQKVCKFAEKNPGGVATVRLEIEPEFRNPMAEIRLNDWREKAPSSRTNGRNLSGFRLRVSFGSRISNFGFRVESGPFHPGPAQKL
jgi:hypothetical protein